MAGKSKLEDAYKLESPDDNLEYYEDWAESYDAEFVDKYGYITPLEVARLFLAEFAGDGPVLDVGAGTGVMGEHLGPVALDGIDISGKMLAEAKRKGFYRALVEADLTKPLPLLDGAYDGFVSTGTFTHGHVGPDCLDELLRIAKPGALFCLSTIESVFDGAGFGSEFARLVAHRRIEPVRFEEVQMYKNVDHDHANDKGLVAIFRKL